jgi:hypothetical protein
MPDDMTEIHAARTTSRARRHPPPQPIIPPEIMETLEDMPPSLGGVPAPYPEAKKIPAPSPEELWKRATGQIEVHRPEGPVIQAGKMPLDQHGWLSLVAMLGVEHPKVPPPVWFARLIISPKSGPHHVKPVILEIGSDEDWQMMSNELSVPSYARWIEIWVTWGAATYLMWPPYRASAPDTALKLLALKLPPAQQLNLFEEFADGSEDRTGAAGETAEVHESLPDPAQLTFADSAVHGLHDELRCGEAPEGATGGAAARQA